MQQFLLTLACLIAYTGGLVILIKVTPRLLFLSYDEGMFMGIAAADVIGAILVFGAVGFTFALFNGNIPIRVLDFLLLVGILIVGIRLSLRSFRPRNMKGMVPASRVIAGSYCFLLFVAALYLIGWLFVAG
jgi:hypothetical protein